MNMQQQEQESEETGMSWSALFKLIVAAIILLLVGVPFVLILIAAWPTIIGIAPYAGYVIIGTLTLAVPTALVCAALSLRSHAENKHFQHHLAKPNANGAFAAYWNGRKWVQPENAPLPIGVNVPHSITQHNSNDPNAIVKLLDYGRTRVTEVPPEIDTRVIVPPAFDLMDVVHTPEFKSGVFLGRIGTSRSVVSTTPGKELCHGAIDAPTGGGKTILIRGIEPQLLAEGFRVVHADVKFTMHDRTYNLDYRPIAKALLGQGNIPGTNLPHLLVTPKGVREIISFVAGPVIDHRLVLYREGEMDQLTLFYFFLEELAYLQSLQGRDKSLSQDLDKILMVGRSLNIKLFTAAQNFQTQNSGVNTGNRENFESAWYLGGDDKSGAAILDVKEAELKKIVTANSIQLGKGATFFRNNSIVPDATVMRAGMASNQYVYHMLGRADDFVLPAEVTGNGKREVTETLHDENLRAFQGGMTGNGNFPTHGSRRLVERREALPDTLPPRREVSGSLGSASPQTGSFLPKGDDKLLPENLHEKLFSYYQDKGTVNEALEKMGITNSRFRRHAKFLVDQFLNREREG